MIICAVVALVAVLVALYVVTIVRTMGRVFEQDNVGTEEGE